MKQYLNFGRFSQNIPQSEPIPGKNMTLNNANAYSFSVDDATRLKRFLILGSAAGTYYVQSRELTKQNLDVVERMLADGKGREVVTTIVEISQAGRAVSNDPALFALARCVAADDVDIRRYALSLLPQVARTGTHLLHFVAYTKQFRGWGRAYRNAVASWFNKRQEKNLAYQLLKYQNRDGYRQRDLLRLAHPKAETGTYNTLYHWVVKGWEGVGDEPHPDPALQIIWAYERAKTAQDDAEVARLITQYKLPREAVPTQHLHSVKVWEALLEDMPIEAMMRNLATMTKEGILTPMGENTARIAACLRDEEAIKRARLHPIKILAALTTYISGRGALGHHSWNPVPQIADALNDAFYLSFVNVEPTNKRILLAIDTSGSMHGRRVNGIANMSLHTACGALALTLLKTEPNVQVIGVDTSIQHLTISASQRLDDVVRTLERIGGGGTDLSLPMVYALQKRLFVDAFIILTDSESWRGGHPSLLLDQYRCIINPEAKIINVQMTATHVTNNDPNDRRALDCVGFDTNVPSIISSFLTGEL